MELNILNNFKIGTKGNDFIFTFVDELAKSLSKEKVINNEVKGKTMLEQDDIKVTTKFRDKLKLQTNQLLNDYAAQTLGRGNMYYIYNKNSIDESTYNVSICDDGKSHEVLELDEDELPLGAKVGSILRNENGEYILDEEATLEMENRINELTQSIIKEQSVELENNRIEGHIYEISGIGNDRVWLFDITENDEDGLDEIEEIDFPEELLSDISEGDKVVYRNGEYVKDYS